MAPVFHYFGVFLLLAGWVLLLVASISAPVINHLSLAKVVLTNQTHLRNSSVSFGSFGYCILDVPPVDTQQDYCTRSHIGYQPSSVMASIEGTNFNVVASSTTNGLTNAFVLHPVGAAVAFIAFLVAIIPTWVTSLLGAIIAVIAFIISLVVMAIDFSVFGVIKNNVNRDGTGSHATYGTAMWLVLAATVALFIGAIIVFCSCCATRNKRRHSKSAYADGGAAPVAPGRRRWFGRRRY